MKIVYIEALKEPRFVEIDGSLESMQELVGGYIEQYMPFTDDVAIICNEEGKMLGKPLNRAILDENGNILDIIAGTFFLVWAPPGSEEFQPLPDEMAKKYMELFRCPEEFVKIDGKIVRFPVM